jgi:uncharacterized protein YndB with AHSA1/START domain
LRRTIRVRCSVDHAFAVFTDRIDQWWPPGHRRWADSQLRLEAVVGGRFFERTPEGEEATLGEVVDVQPPHRIVYTWYPGAIDAPTRVEIRFAAEGADTIVDVVHAEGDSGRGEQWPSRVAKFERGWQHVLAAFAARIEVEMEGT